MNFSDKAIAILQATEDGNKLEPSDLKLVEIAVNNRLTDRGVELFNALHEQVVSGEYSRTPHWFHGIEHMTKDGVGYVYWKGAHVEHYSFSDRDREKAAAESLAERCRLLESKGIPVNGRSVSAQSCYAAPAGTPWIKALLRYYTFFQKADGKVVGIFYLENRSTSPLEVVCATKVEDSIDLTYYPSAYDAYHGLAGQGLVSMGCHPSYAQVAGWLEATGLTPSELDALIAAPAAEGCKQGRAY